MLRRLRGRIKLELFSNQVRVTLSPSEAMQFDVGCPPESHTIILHWQNEFQSARGCQRYIERHLYIVNNDGAWLHTGNSSRKNFGIVFLSSTRRLGDTSSKPCSIQREREREREREGALKPSSKQYICGWCWGDQYERFIWGCAFMAYSDSSVKLNNRLLLRFRYSRDRQVKANMHWYEHNTGTRHNLIRMMIAVRLSVSFYRWVVVVQYVVEWGETQKWTHWSRNR